MTNYNNLAIEIYASGTTRINDPADELTRAQDLAFTTLYPGGLYGTCAFYVPRDVARAWAVQGAQRLVARNGLAVVWEGQIDDLEYALSAAGQGLRVTANGYWGTLLLRERLRKWWADNRLTEDLWLFDVAATGAEKCRVEREAARLRIFANNGTEWLADEYIRLSYTSPVGQTVKRITLDYYQQELGVFEPAAVKKTDTLTRLNVDAALDDNTDTWLETMHDGDTGTSGNITLTAANTWYIGMTAIPATGTASLQFDLGSVNNNAATLTVAYWDGAAWTSLVITDGTANPPGTPLAQDGAMTFTVPQDWDERRVLNKKRFWLKLNVDIDLDQISVLDFVAGLTSDITDGDTVTLSSDDYWYVIAARREALTGIRVTLGGSVNNNAATLSAEYWSEQREEWRTLTITDGTAVGGATLAQSGDITFTRPDDLERASIGNASGYPLRLKPSATLDAVQFDALRVLGQQQWQLSIWNTTTGLSLLDYTGNGGATTDLTLATPSREVEFRWYAKARQIPIEDAFYADFSNVMVYSETGAINPTEIAKDVRAAIARLNSSEIEIDDNPLPLAPFIADNFETAGEILQAALQYGDASYNPWAAGVYASERAATPDGKPVLFLEQQPALTDYDYQVSLDDPNVDGDLQIVRDWGEVWNWIPVRYSDENGRQQYVTPDDDPTLKDQASINQWGQRVPPPLDVGQAGLAVAVSYGQRYLEKYKDVRFILASPVRLRGYVKGKSNNRVPASQVRAGQRLRLMNFLSDLRAAADTRLTWLITQAEYNDASETVTLYGDAPSNLEVLLAQLTYQQDNKLWR